MAKKVVDKWKLKKWYTVYAPDVFEKKELGQIPSDEEWKLLNRKVRVSLAELTGDYSQMQNFVIFRIVKVQGSSAFTEATGQELSRTYLKMLVRRRSDVLEVVVDGRTSDGVDVRVKVIAYTATCLTGPTKHDIRKKMMETATQVISSLPFSTLIQEVVFGKFSTRIFGAIKKIGPIRRVEVRKTEIKNVVEVERPETEEPQEQDDAPRSSPKSSKHTAKEAAAPASRDA